MPAFSLLNLRLHAALRYGGIENPPFSGLGGNSGSGPVPAADSPLAASPGLAEGREELFVFEAEELVAFDQSSFSGRMPSLANACRAVSWPATTIEGFSLSGTAK